MPWQEVSTVSLRHEFVMLASADEANIRELCRRFHISPTTAYKWQQRYAAQGLGGLHDRSRRPQRSPGQTPARMEHAVLALREAHPAWGGRKIHARLRALAHRVVPSPSTITAILRRQGRLEPDEAPAHQAGAQSHGERGHGQPGPVAAQAGEHGAEHVTHSPDPC